VKKPLSLVFAAVLAAASRGKAGAGEPFYRAVIAAVIDGGTVTLRFTGAVPEGRAGEERVRLIGVDTPELSAQPPEHYAAEARAYTNRFWRQAVTFRFDTASAPQDRYGRLPGYVSVPGQGLLNLLLIENGMGRYYGAFAFEPGFMRAFREAEEKAKKNKTGLWG
jgi:endonuclease YncB( thermonuclease family)